MSASAPERSAAARRSRGVVESSGSWYEARVTPQPFVVIAAFYEEAKALLDIVAHGPQEAGPPTLKAYHPLYVGDLDSRRRFPGFLVHLGGAGRVRVAVSTAHAIHTWNPRLLLIVGTAGGFKGNGVALGDILVATEILDYEAQRLGEGDPVYRTATYRPCDFLIHLARTITLEKAPHIDGLPGRTPRIHFGPLFSGDKVVASEEAAGKLLALRKDAYGVEMEGAGLAFAAGSVPFLMVRGVADHADRRKSEDFQRWRDPACRSAAQFVEKFLKAWVEQIAKQEEP